MNQISNFAPTGKMLEKFKKWEKEPTGEQGEGKSREQEMEKLKEKQNRLMARQTEMAETQSSSRQRQAERVNNIGSQAEQRRLAMQRRKRDQMAASAGKLLSTSNLLIGGKRFEGGSTSKA